ncbi:MAG: 3-dehydroquinate synthase [Anaerolineaceae bacterium]|nr:3-dehydroquinate synthase [Anaerolineaceae bacterium]
MNPKTIFLYGPPGSGKTSVGKILAQKLNRDFVDLDVWIENRSNRSIPELFENEGEAAFRVLETAALKEIIQDNTGSVVALGGGALLNGENRRLVNQNGQIVCLMASEETLLNRLKTADTKRPLIADNLPQKLKSLLEKRTAHYQSFDPLDVKTLSITEAADLVQRHLGLFHVTGMGSGYDVFVKPGLLAEVGAYCKQYGLKGPVVVVSDRNVAAHYRKVVLTSLEQAGYTTAFVSLNPGEAFKTIDTVEKIWQAFLNAGLERGSTVLALGGGVVSDLAGFAAATYKRGVSWVVCPTSLLAMVDAGLGGKTGADLPAGKNLIGAFHAPRLILADPDCLKTLPAVELRNGMGEVIKHGLIADPNLFQLCAGDWQFNLTRLVTDAMAVKIKIICEDPLEQGRRAVLNLGHTIGHALELVSDFKLKHGEAVGLGLLAEAQLAEDMGLVLADNLVTDIFETLVKVGLPVCIPAGMDLEKVMMVMQHDKKRSGGVVRFALPLRVGEARTGYEVNPRLVRTVLTGLQVEEGCQQEGI